MLAARSRALRFGAVGLLVGVSLFAADSDLPLFGALKPGEHPVGFRVIPALAASAGPDVTPRPIEVALWYPSIRRSEDPMRFGEYLAISPDLRERSTGPPGGPALVPATDLAGTLSIAVTGDPKGLSPELAGRILMAPMLARRDAPPAEGKFPLVLWGSRYGTAAAQAIMSEWLASQGFVVAFGRPHDDRWKMPFELVAPSEKADELDRQVRDLRGALQSVRGRGEVDPANTFLVTWSYAGEAVFGLHRSDPRIRGVVALSTNLLDGWVYAPAEAIPSIPDGPLDVPVLLMDQERNRNGELRPVPAAFANLPPGSARVVFPTLAHGSFNAVEGMLPGIYGIANVQPWSKGGSEARIGYETITRFMGLWMEQILGDPAAPREREALLASLPPGFARYESAPARPRAPLAGAEVEFPSADGLAVSGTLYRPPPGVATRACVLLVHQSGSSRGEYAVIGPALARRGYFALAVDLRAGRRDRWASEWNATARRAGALARIEGGDQPAFAAIRRGAREDLVAAQSFLAAQPGCEAGVVPWGSSFSANFVLERAAEAPQTVRAVVSFSPGEYNRESPEHMQGIVKNLKAPALIVWAEREVGDTATPKILEAVPGAKAGYASPTGYHGSSILFEDPLAWTALWRFLDGLPAASP